MRGGKTGGMDKKAVPEAPPDDDEITVRFEDLPRRVRAAARADLGEELCDSIAAVDCSRRVVMAMARDPESIWGVPIDTKYKYGITAAEARALKKKGGAVVYYSRITPSEALS